MDSQSGAGKSVERVRVSDAEREAVVARLNDATSEGRLTLEEFSDRVTDALAARTRGDLDRLVVDLPPVGVTYPRSPAPGHAPQAIPASHITPVGSIKRKGRWRLDRDTSLGTIVGSIKLDLRHAEFAGAEVSLHVQSIVGSVKVWIPHGIAVEVDGQSFVGSRSVEDDIARPDAPLLRLRVDTIVGSVKIFRV